MIQNTSDFITFVLLLIMPIVFLVFYLRAKLKDRERKIISRDEKYYREW